VHDLPPHLARLFPEGVARAHLLSRGVGGSIYRITLPDASTRILKTSPDLDLRVEARMLDLLRAHDLPTPRVHAATRDALVLDFIESDASTAETHAAELLAALHAHASPDRSYGLSEPNTIGPLPQDNTPAAHWPTFFRERRLLPMAALAARRGSLTPALHARLECLAHRLDDLLPSHPHPGLIHGDVWSGNILTRNRRVAAFIDPAPYHADPEVELAFITMFHTFARPFFDAYHARRPIDPAFFSRRRDVYVLYPLLVHVTLFPGGYDADLDATLTRLRF
jgi:fructosamine-3-kinase